MKSSFITQLSPGETVDDLFALRRVDLKEYPGGRMITLELVDRSGRMNGVIWDGTTEIMKGLRSGGVFRVRGSVATYKGENQITVQAAEKVAEYDPGDFVAQGPHAYEDLDSRLTEAIEKVEDRHYRSLLDSVFSAGGQRRGFLQGVGGKLWHHSYTGGLAEHSLAIFDLCLDLSIRYKELDRDLLLAGALLHDIGKVESYSLEASIEYTDSGRLLGHIVIGDRMISGAIGGITDFPQEKALKIRHLILSHQGSPEQSSPVPPMTPEGMVLYIADLLDSRLAALRRIKEREYRPGVRWSNFVRLLDRFIYFGNHGDEDEQEDI
jgi:3'-5' exoribonuclease